MSFNAPFTTLGYYSWLFDDNPNTTDSALVPIPSQSADISLGANNLTIANDKGYYSGTNMQLPDEFQSAKNNSDFSTTINAKTDSHDNIFTLPASQSRQRLVNASYQNNKYFSTPSIGRDAVSDTQSSQLHNDMHGIVGNIEYTPSTSTFSDHSDPNSSNVLNSAVTTASLSSHDWSSSVKSSTSQISSPPAHRSTLRNGQPLPDAYIALPGSKLPLVSSEARDSIMREITQSRPTKPDGSEVSSSDPLLSLSSLQHYSDLFFTRFNSSYPLIHQATFDSNNVHNFLLMSILLLGATYSDKEAHLLAVCIHDIMRPLIHSSKEFSTRPKLWMLQTILLVECFGKSRAGEKQHDMRLVSPFKLRRKKASYPSFRC
jgi:hypothetical protein